MKLFVLMSIKAKNFNQLEIFADIKLIVILFIAVIVFQMLPSVKSQVECKQAMFLHVKHLLVLVKV